MPPFWSDDGRQCGMDRDEIRLRKRFLEAWPGHVTLVEPGTFGATPGAPDASLACATSRPWVEFKVADAQGFFKLERAQPGWHNAYNEHRHDAYFVIMTDLAIWIARSRRVMPFINGLIGNVHSFPAQCLPWSELPRVSLPSLLELIP
jgi:hypothetical protein